MESLSRTIRHDEALKLEAYCLKNYLQLFPRHFHDYYVFGFIVSGERELLCNSLSFPKRRIKVTSDFYGLTFS